MAIEGQAPEPGQSGAFLTPGSTSGTRVDFIDQTSIGSVSFTVSASGFVIVQADILIWDPSVPSVLRNDETLKTWSESLVWPFFDIFVDVNSLDHEYGVGSALTSAQKNILVGPLNLITPDVGVSQTVSMMIKNFDTSPHTLFLYLGSKYVIIE